jgi:hypothetical protein
MQSINNINEILQRKTIEKDIKNILLNFEEKSKDINFKRGIYVYGSPGVGKSKFVENIIKDIGFDMIKYDASDVRNKAMMESIASKNTSNCNVLDMMTKQKKNIVIVMDDVEGFNNSDKGGCTSLLKLIRQKKTKLQKTEHNSLSPIICIGSYFVDKKIKEIMNVCNLFELHTPCYNDICRLYRSVITDIDDVTDQLHNMVVFSKGDMRKIQLMFDLYKINPDIINDKLFSETLQSKNNEEDAKQITSSLFENSHSINEHNSHINDNNRTVVGLLFHENIVNQMIFEKIKDPISLYLELLNVMSFADYIDRTTFQNQIWQFNEMSSLLKSYYCSHIFNSHKNDLGTYTKVRPEIEFTKILTKYSTEYNNQFFIYKMCQELELDKKDINCFFQELRVYFGIGSDDNMESVLPLFEGTEISKLDIKRMFRYLDKTTKKEAAFNQIEEIFS